MGGIDVVDPRELLRSASDLMKKTSDSMVELVGKGANIVEESLEAEKSTAEDVSPKHKAKHRK
jgi:hypothetical protein